MAQSPNETISVALRQRLGLLPGDRVGVLGEFGEMRPVYRGLWALGACAVPLDVGTLKNTETLNASEAIYVIASERTLARAVQAVEPGIHNVLGARLVREVIQFGGVAGEVFPHIDAALLVDALPTDMTSEALLLYLYFIGKVQQFAYTLNDLIELSARLRGPNKPRPKFAVVGFYPIVEEMMVFLAS